VLHIQRCGLILMTAGAGVARAVLSSCLGVTGR
jgi:hypothetical protein